VHSYTDVDYLETYAENPKEVFAHSNIEGAMANVFQQTRKFLMLTYGITDQEATSVISLCVDFGITQCVDGNWGMHGIVPKSPFDPDVHKNAKPLTSKELTAPKILRATNETVHWGYFSKKEKPVMTVKSGDEAVIEMVTLNAGEDYDKMVLGDPGMESIYHWSKTQKNIKYRGAMGVGDGAHVMTGPVWVEDAEPGDVLAVSVLDLQPRLNPDGKTFGSNPAGNWGYQARVPQADGSKYRIGTLTGDAVDDEVVTIYELLTDADTGEHFAVPCYQYEWPEVTDPDGTTRDAMVYPGTLIPHTPHGDTVPTSTVADMGWTTTAPIKYKDDLFPVKVPVKYHIGNMGLPPSSHDFVQSVPPMPSGGNIDDWRIGVGITMYYPVEVAGALFSTGDTHSAQGDSELQGTAIETSVTGKFKFELIKKAKFNAWQKILDFPLGETDTHYIVHSFTEMDYLETYKEDPSEMFKPKKELLDPALRNCFTQTRKFLVAAYGLTEKEATTIITTGVDFQITQVVNFNFGVHAYIPKSIFEAKPAKPVVCPQECSVKGRHSRALKFGTVIDCSGCFAADESAAEED